MVYDFSEHIDRQLEYFLEGITNNNNNFINISLDNIQDLIDDDDFVKKLDEFMNSLDNKLKIIENECLKLVHVSKSLEEAVNIINKAKVDGGDEYNKYLKLVKSFVINYLKKVE